jgi:hypothetical protein
MHPHFAELISEFCATAALDAPLGIMNGAGFQNDGVTFSLRHDNGVPPTMLVYTDFGPVPAHSRYAIYLMLLKDNCITAMGGAGTFGMSSKSRNIVYVEQLALDNLTVPMLYDRFAWLTSKVKEWRTTHLARDAPMPVPAPVRPGSTTRALNFHNRK